MSADVRNGHRTIVDYYASTGVESARLERGDGLLEKLRTLALLQRRLPPPPADVLDVGGATGVYALPLARQGYRVHLVDPVPRHVDEAKAASAAQADAPLAGVLLGDARSLDFRDACFDAVLLMGPLYHLTERADRLTALGEARRCLRSGGLVAAAAISRFASLLDGFRAGFVEDAAFRQILDRDLREGQHRNPTDKLQYFTTGFFHHPDELRAEVIDAGFGGVEVFAVEGPAWLAPRIHDYMRDAAQREMILALIERIEQEPAILGVSSHLLVVGRAG